MGRYAKSSTIEVLDGLYLRKVARSPYYQLSFSHNGSVVRVSTKCDIVDDAKQYALRYYVDYKDGGSQFQKGISFRKLMEAYLKSISDDGKFAYHSAIIKRHFLPYFAKTKDISTISTAHIQRYVQHRKDKSNPTPQTLNRENTVLRQMFAYAVQARWLKAAVVIEHHSEKATRSRRPHFTVEEYRQLYKAARKRIAETLKEQRAANARAKPLFTRRLW